MTDPDYIYDPDDWEYTHAYKYRGDLIEDLDLSEGEIKRFSTLVKGPDRFAAFVVVTRDAAGYPDETEIRWFDTEAEARAAAGLPIQALL